MANETFKIFDEVTIGRNKHSYGVTFIEEVRLGTSAYVELSPEKNELLRKKLIDVISCLNELSAGEASMMATQISTWLNGLYVANQHRTTSF